MRAELLRGSGYSAYRAHLETLLDISVLASDMDIYNSITKGFPAARLVQLTEDGTVSPLERDQIIPPQALKNRINRDQLLTVEESDRFFRVAHIHAMADAVFGESEKAKHWLSKPKVRFGGMAPMQMLTTQQGTSQVEEMLLQLAKGVVL
ncbi:antitoxin Xre/MbcA/ParS toxin-binding domain-containing protein [Pseudomonas marincola]|uniref:antitoxin Xre/MbcA/ParS toxin-binding domain-containing protein n=1 Tax=Pseudomonas marincola TaxID=437900 RepID=UPI0008F3CE51|nr:antitoxin Xre/MbcA/ParS toxin-binding domain-containing protein [Pseudomonas marincola]SFU20290.1 putative toxin-antitoxin system antitoxin component, TIGR02293 family [Pseudomonas marincola]